MKTSTTAAVREESFSEGALDHLNLALQAESVETKNFHIRTALQYQFGALDE
ncbi:hypothetical protein [Halolamina sediminis]|jgi:hypothetical protein|uniref:hypothetical protein n=1 Tax=Halolamina sediminis TaxID=1480675 RepID=UPI0012AB4D49|nr:hypothetical protein [Halolamina sediminis]